MNGIAAFVSSFALGALVDTPASVRRAAGLRQAVVRTHFGGSA